MGKRSSEAHEGAVEKKILAFDPEVLTIVEEEGADLADDRSKEPPPESFILNIMHYGVRQPITVRKNPETGKTEVVDGRKRVLGCREANKRLKKRGDEPWRVSAVPARAGSGDAIGLMITLNEQRVEDSPLNLAKKCARMMERGKTEEEVALAIGKSTATLKNMLGLLDAPAVVRHAVENGKVSVSDGYKLSKLSVDDAKKKVGQLLAHAPRTPGKKRSPNARKAREIVGGATGSHEGMRAINQVENLKRELGEEHAEAVSALQWVLGEDVDLEKVFGIKWP